MKKASGIGIIYKNSILLARRVEYYNGEEIPLGGYWSIFGGSFNTKENAMVCAIRELYEESGIEVDFHSLQFSRTIYSKDVQFTVYFVELEERPEPILNDEHTEFGWFFIDKIDQFPYDIDPELVECIKMFQKNRYTE